jgi:hypothetical protein
MDECEKSHPHRYSIPGSSSTKRVAIPTKLSQPTFNKLYITYFQSCQKILDMYWFCEICVWDDNRFTAYCSKDRRDTAERLKRFVLLRNSNCSEGWNTLPFFVKCVNACDKISEHQLIKKCYKQLVTTLLLGFNNLKCSEHMQKYKYYAMWNCQAGYKE